MLCTPSEALMYCLDSRWIYSNPDGHVGGNEMYSYVFADNYIIQQLDLFMGSKYLNMYSQNTLSEGQSRLYPQVAVYCIEGILRLPPSPLSATRTSNANLI